MVIQLLLFIFGLAILLPSTNILVKNAEVLAARLKISPLITGITLVALGTSLPELAVSTTAAINNDYGLALGNIIGSNITNVLLVFPIGIIIGKLRIGSTKTQRTVLILTAFSFVFFILHFADIKPVFLGCIFLLLGTLVTLLEYIWGFEGSDNEDKRAVQKLVHNEPSFKLKHLLSLFGSLVGIILGGLLIFFSAENISALSGYSTTVLGLSLTAVATSLPELFTTIFSQSEDQEKLTLGNIIGSNIYNLTIIGGVSAFFYRKIVLPNVDWLWFIVAALILILVVKVFSKNVVPKVVGLILLSLFVFYIYSLSFAS